MIIVIAGPTGVGKTKLSIELAKALDGIVINADAVQIYKELNIGSAKVTEAEKEGIPHYLFDIRSVNEEYNAHDYQIDSRNIIEDNKDKNIIMVGGTGLYMCASLMNYDFIKEQSDLKIIYPDVYFIGLTTNRENLYNIINKRVDKMLENGLLDEVKNLYQKYPQSKVLNRAIGYKELIEYLNNETTLDDAIEKIKQNSRHYAKRQFTWFNNKMNINWFNVDYDNFNNTIEEVKKYVFNCHKK